MLKIQRNGIKVSMGVLVFWQLFPLVYYLYTKIFFGVGIFETFGTLWDIPTNFYLIGSKNYPFLLGLQIFSQVVLFTVVFGGYLIFQNGE